MVFANTSTVDTYRSMGFAEKLADARKRSGFTQTALAMKLEVSQSSLSGWEHGAADPTLANLVALARVLDVSLDWLIDDTRTEPLDLERRLRHQIKALGFDATWTRLTLLPEGDRITTRAIR